MTGNQPHVSVHFATKLRNISSIYLQPAVTYLRVNCWVSPDFVVPDDGVNPGKLFVVFFRALYNPELHNGNCHLLIAMFRSLQLSNKIRFDMTEVDVILKAFH